MPELVTLTEDGPLGAAGSQVWVDDASDVEATPKVAHKRTEAKPDDKPDTE